MDDRLLIKRFVSHGDERAFRALVQEYLPLVYGVALKLVRDHHLAEDVSQTTFNALAQVLQKQESVGYPRAWLYETARKQAITVVRKERRRRLREETAVMMELAATDSSSPPNDWGLVLNEAMDRLSVRDRTALFLRYFEGHTFAEMGTHLGIEERAAQKRVQRAIERLQRKLLTLGIALTPGMLKAELFMCEAGAIPRELAETIATTALSGSKVAPAAFAWLQGGLLLKLGAGLLAVVIPSTVIWQVTAKLPKLDEHQSTGVSGPGYSILADSRIVSGFAGQHAVDDIEAIYRLEEAEREIALRALMAHLRDQRDEDYFSDLFNRWTVLDAPRAARALVSLYQTCDEADESHCALLGQLFAVPLKHWLEQDAEAAKSWVKALSRDGYEEARAFEALVKLVSAEDLDAGYTLLASRSHNRPEIVEAFVRALDSDRELTEMLAKLEGLPEDVAVADVGKHGEYVQRAGTTKTAVWKAAIPRLFECDAEALADWIISLPSSDRTHEVTKAFVERWAAGDPRAASEWALTLPKDEQQVVVEGLVRAWAGVDADEARAWIDALPESLIWGARETAFEIWIESGVDHMEVQRQLGNWSDRPEAGVLYGMAADRMPGQEVYQWARDLGTDSVNREFLLERAFFALGRESAPDAMGLMNQLEPSEQGIAVEALSLGWLVSGGRREFEAWRQSLDPNSRRFYQATAAKVDLLAAINPALVADDVLAMPQDRDRDFVLMRLIGRVRPRSKESALQWVEELVDPKLKRETLALIENADFPETMDLPTGKLRDFKTQTLGELRERLDLLAKRPLDR